jgi:decaprenyl-phosphate phosphoribosyltransferase
MSRLRRRRTYPRLPAPLRAVRPRQWSKNLLVGAAPLAAGKLLERQVLVSVALAFVTFCLVSAMVYLLNDVRDVEEETGCTRGSGCGRSPPAS